MNSDKNGHKENTEAIKTVNAKYQNTDTHNVLVAANILIVLMLVSNGVNFKQDVLLLIRPNGLKYNI